MLADALSGVSPKENYACKRVIWHNVVLDSCAGEMEETVDDALLGPPSSADCFEEVDAFYRSSLKRLKWLLQLQRKGISHEAGRGNDCASSSYAVAVTAFEKPLKTFDIHSKRFALVQKEAKSETKRPARRSSKKDRSEGSASAPRSGPSSSAGSSSYTGPSANRGGRGRFPPWSRRPDSYDYKKSS